MGKTLGQMTPAERRAAIQRAADAMQRELTAAAPAIGAALDGWSWDAELQRWTAELDGRMIVWRSGADAPPSMTPEQAAAQHEAWHGRGNGAPSRPDAQRVQSYADKIMAMVGSDIAAGIVPAAVASFSALHDYVDANEYVLQAMPGIADDFASESAAELCNAVTGEVDRRLSERSAGSAPSGSF